jgi:hypothetical protein
LDGLPSPLGMCWEPKNTTTWLTASDDAMVQKELMEAKYGGNDYREGPTSE